MNQDAHNRVAAAGINPDHWPTVVKLVEALLEKKNSNLTEIIERACRGTYHDFLTKRLYPLVLLAQEMQEAGYPDFKKRVVDGEFDASHEEGQRWAKTTMEGRAAFQALINGLKQGQVDHK